MKWNQDIFNRNLEYLIDTKFKGNQSRFNDKIGRDSATRWKKSRPSLENLLAITEECDCTLDWLLTGKKTDNKTCEVECGEHITELCKKVKDVVESGTHWGASLEANIHSFKAGLDGDKERGKMKEDMIELKKSIRGSLSDMGQKPRGVKKKARI